MAGNHQLGHNLSTTHRPPPTTTDSMVPRNQGGNNTQQPHCKPVPELKSTNIWAQLARPCWTPKRARMPAEHSPRCPMQQTHRHNIPFTPLPVAPSETPPPPTPPVRAHGAVALLIYLATTAQLVRRLGFCGHEASLSSGQQPESAEKQVRGSPCTQGSQTSTSQLSNKLMTDESKSSPTDCRSTMAASWPSTPRWLRHSPAPANHDGIQMALPIREPPV